MSKKILSGVLAIAMLATMGSLCAVGASAEENDIKGGEITYRISKSWKYEDAKYYIHIWDGRENGKGLYKWQTKNELMTISEDGETATYYIPAGDWNLLILSESRGMQTFDTVFNQNCIGDTFTTISDGTHAPVDSHKDEYIIKWDNNPDCGTHKIITALGSVTGTTLLPGESNQSLYDDFCKKYDINNKADGETIFNWNDDGAIETGMTWDEIKAQLAEELGVTETPTEAPTEAPTENPTLEPTNAPTEKPTEKSNNSSNGTVNTSDSSALATLSAVLISALGVTAISKKRKTNI